MSGLAQRKSAATVAAQRVEGAAYAREWKERPRAAVGPYPFRDHRTVAEAMP